MPRSIARTIHITFQKKRPDTDYNVVAQKIRPNL